MAGDTARIRSVQARCWIRGAIVAFLSLPGCAVPPMAEPVLADCETRAISTCPEGPRSGECRSGAVRSCMAEEGWEKGMLGWISRPAGLEPVLERCRRESAKKCGPVVSGAECVGPRIRACMADLGWEPAQLGWRKVVTTDTEREEEIEDRVPDRGQ
jgi:hypothetical protein